MTATADARLQLADDFAASEVIRPAAVLWELSARAILRALAADDVTVGGVWSARTGVWRRYDKPWDSPDSPGSALHLGTISCVYDSPHRYSVTIYRASVTTAGIRAGWTVENLCDDALQYADLDLASCPRVELRPPPRPYTPQ
ncbi:MAG: hypothetical protein JO079_11670 [Frankiaceae bacterium]|nr:hypothetical protein [Frankiaceae bacterium]MBV9368910.1 hypothetical protein [Frankiales bacterium]